MEEKKAIYLKWLKRILLFLVFFDLGLGIWAIGFPSSVLKAGNLPIPPEPIFVRGVGVFWLLVAYIQFLAWKDPIKRLLALHIAIIFRIAGATFEAIEGIFLLRPFSQIHFILGIFVVGDVALVIAMIWLLKKLGLCWRKWETQ
jgi:hypothetical protein